MEAVGTDVLEKDLACPICGENTLRAIEFEDRNASALRCEICRRSFPIENGIVNFLLQEKLDQTNLDEIAGNVYDLSNATYVEKATNKQNWSRAYSHSLLYALNRTKEMIRSLATREMVLISMGSGTGFELKVLCKELSFARVYSSDISASAVSLVPVTLRDVEVSVGLFVAEFLNAPMKRKGNCVGLVFQALHHTTDIHQALDVLLARVETLVIVEPTTNCFIEILAKFGLAKRIEYSGLTPSWLDLNCAKQIAAANGFGMRVRTWWEIPPYISSRLDKVPLVCGAVILLVDAFSHVTNWFRFGSMSCAMFTRRSEKEPKQSNSC